MSLQSINLGTVADDGTGDNLRVGAQKINDNLTELYTALSSTGSPLTLPSDNVVYENTTQTLINKTITGSFTGDISGNVTGNLFGDIYASNGSSKILDAGTDGSDASFTGTVNNIGNFTVGGDLSVSGNGTISGDVVIGTSASDSVTFDGSIISDIVPLTGSSHDLGLAGKEWRRIFVDTLANNGFFYSLPSATTTLVGNDTSDILSNKRLDNPIIDGSLIFEGATDDTAEITLTPQDPTTDISLLIPAENGTLATQGFSIAVAVALG